MLSPCSTRCLFKLAGLFALVAAHNKNQISTQTQQNIELCFPELDKSAKQRLISSSIHHTSCAFIELASLWNHPINRVLGKISSQNIAPEFHIKNRAKIIIAPHHGSWELLNLWLAQQGPLYALYKPGKSASIDQYVFEKRSRNNAILVPANTSGLRTLLLGLKNNASSMILPDQKPASNTAQIDAPFFGYPAKTSLLIKKLADKVDCDVFIGATTRDLVNADYHLCIVKLSREQLLADDLTSASYLNQSIESFISDNLSQYQWAYRRFDKSVYASAIDNAVNPA